MRLAALLPLFQHLNFDKRAARYETLSLSEAKHSPENG